MENDYGETVRGFSTSPICNLKIDVYLNSQGNMLSQKNLNFFGVKSDTTIDDGVFFRTFDIKNYFRYCRKRLKFFGGIFMKKIFGLVAIFLMISANCFAGIYGEKSNQILNEMYREPARYIDFGFIGMGMCFFVDKNSIRVDQYNPPNYIIAFREIPFSINGGNHAFDNGNVLTRYKYDYKSNKIYREFHRNGDVNQPFWEELDTNVNNFGGRTGDSRLVWLSEGEVAFYLAYNMSFYKKPLTEILKERIKSGKWKTFENFQHR